MIRGVSRLIENKAVQVVESVEKKDDTYDNDETQVRTIEDGSELPVEELEIHSAHISSNPPDGGYGWVCVGCAFMFNFAGWGANSSFGIFLDYFNTHHTFPDSTPLEVAFIGGLSIGLGSLCAPLITICLSRLGIHATLIIGGLLSFLGYFCAAYTKEIWQLFLTQGVIIGLSIGFLFIPASNILPQWFQKRRAMAQGIATSGTGVGGIAFSFLTQWSIETLGVAWAFRIVAIITIVCAGIGTAFVRTRNHIVKPSKKTLDHTVLRFPLICILIWIGLSMTAYVIMLYSITSYATSIGLSSKQGTDLLAIMCASQVVGRPISGHVCDRWGRINVTALTNIISGVIVAAYWIPVKSFGGMIGFVVLLGLVMGTVWVSYAPLVADSAGLQKLPSAYTFASIASGLPGIFAEVIAMEIRQGKTTGNSYLWVQVFVAIAFFVGGLTLLVLREHKVKKLVHQKLDQSCSFYSMPGETTAHDSEYNKLRALDGPGVVSYFRRLLHPCVV